MLRDTFVLVGVNLPYECEVTVIFRTKVLFHFSMFPVFVPCFSSDVGVIFYSARLVIACYVFFFFLIVSLMLLYFIAIVLIRVSVLSLCSVAMNIFGSLHEAFVARSDEMELEKILVTYIAPELNSPIGWIRFRVR